MPRRARVVKRVIAPDAKYQSGDLAKFINRIMYSGKKSTAERVVYKTMDLLEAQSHRNPLDTFEQALRNATPVVEVKPRRVGGATYQVPVEVSPKRQLSLAIRWIRAAARGKKGRPMHQRLAAELIDAFHREGAAMTVRENTHRMAEANKAFAHFAW